MSDEDEGVPLADALRIYGDPQLWAAHESARAALNKIERRPAWLRSSRWERQAWSERYEEPERTARDAVSRPWTVLVTDFKQPLQRGELIATGMKVPVDEHSQPIVINRYLWSELKPDFTRSSAKGRGARRLASRSTSCRSWC